MFYFIAFCKQNCSDTKWVQWYRCYLSTQAKENLTLIWMHFIIIFLQYNRSNIQNTPGLLWNNGTEMLQGSWIPQHWQVLKITSHGFSVWNCWTDCVWIYLSFYPPSSFSLPLNHLEIHPLCVFQHFRVSTKARKYHEVSLTLATDVVPQLSERM